MTRTQNPPPSSVPPTTSPSGVSEAGRSGVPTPAGQELNPWRNQPAPREERPPPADNLIAVVLVSSALTLLLAALIGLAWLGDLIRAEHGQ